MQIHQVKPIHKSKKRKRVGRGGKRGTYSGRGMKGQKSRAGANPQPVIRNLIKRYPKKRGYRFKGTSKEVVLFNIYFLEKNFKKNDKINPQVLFKKGLIRKIKKRLPEVKILGKGELTKPFLIENCKASKKAKEKIEKAGGKIK